MNARIGLTGWIITCLLTMVTLAPGAFAEDAAISGADRVYMQGVKAYRLGDDERALNYLRRAASLSPDSVNVRYYLAITLDRLQQDEAAVPHYDYVSQHGRDDRIVAYSRQRLNTLTPEPDGHAYTTQDEESRVAMASTTGPSSAMITPAVYQGQIRRVSVPLKNNRNALMVDAELYDDRLQAKTGGVFIIDTGATYTSISREMAEELGLDLENCEKVRITTANGRIEVPKVTIDRLSVNGLEARNVEATVIHIRQGSSFAGLLGLSFIRQFVLTIDPESHQLIFQQN